MKKIVSGEWKVRACGVLLAVTMAAGNVRFEDDHGGGTECPAPWCFYEKKSLENLSLFQ